jgi:hypothetical protein
MDKIIAEFTKRLKKELRPGLLVGNSVFESTDHVIDRIAKELTICPECGLKAGEICSGICDHDAKTCGPDDQCGEYTPITCKSCVANKIPDKDETAQKLDTAVEALNNICRPHVILPIPTRKEMARIAHEALVKINNQKEHR